MLLGSIVLAGGRSRRMGRAKESLPFRGSTLLGHTVDLLAACTYPVVVVARDPTQELPPLLLETELTFDPQVDQGPLVGIQAGLRFLGAQCDAAFVVGCDTPFLSATAVDWLAHQLGDYDAVMARIEGKLQPLGAIYRVSTLAAVDALITEGVRTPRTLAERVRTRILDESVIDAFDPTRAFLHSVDSPEEYQRAVEASGGG
ncbi:MAG: molybdenum cofactor guanylyltransferase [Planctomycetes bacterium]|nr:molybdenum cofactor guanylyltransferase [Planctomycetota bacterium]MCB9868906.1 molybdenum cofactor guanylyltransferase [Planctomycetota bacterium]